MSRRSRIEWHDNHALVWTWRLTLIVSSVGLLLLGIAAVLFMARTPAEVAGGHAGFMMPAVPGVVALIVAVAGRITSATALRYGDASFPQVPQQTGEPYPDGVRRRSIRRRSGVAYSLMGIIVGGFVAAAVLNWSEQPRAGSLAELALAAGGGIGCYLAGPAARFVVTPEYFRIDTALHRIRVPRHLLDEFSRRGTEIRLGLTDGDHVYFRVDSLLWDARGGKYRINSRAQVRTVERIVAMLDEVPTAGSPDGGVAVTSRRGGIVLAVAAGLVPLAALVALVIQARG